MKIKQIETKSYLNDNLNNPQFIKSVNNINNSLIFKDNDSEKYLVIINESEGEYATVSPILNSIDECEKWS